jgi:hypothetical protein
MIIIQGANLVDINVKEQQVHKISSKRAQGLLEMVQRAANY